MTAHNGLYVEPNTWLSELEAIHNSTYFPSSIHFQVVEQFYIAIDSMLYNAIDCYNSKKKIDNI